VRVSVVSDGTREYGHCSGQLLGNASIHHGLRDELLPAHALDQILSGMGGLVNQSTPRVPNPVNPAEDFADKWGDPKYSHLNLERNFWLWLEQANADFRTIAKARNVDLIVEQAKEKFGVTLGRDGLSERLGLGPANISVTPKTHTITEVPAKPWCRADD